MHIMEIKQLLKKAFKSGTKWGDYTSDKNFNDFMDEHKESLLLYSVINWVAVFDKTPPENETVLAHNGHRIIETSWQDFTGQDEQWFKNTFLYWTKTFKPPSLPY